MRALLAIALSAVLAACSVPRLRGTAWDNRNPTQCMEPHENGIWERNFCRAGRGFLVWAVWRY